MRSQLLCSRDNDSCDDDLRVAFPPFKMAPLPPPPPLADRDEENDLSASFASLLCLTTSANLLSRIVDENSANVSLSGGFSFDPGG